MLAVYNVNGFYIKSVFVQPILNTFQLSFRLTTNINCFLITICITELSGLNISDNMYNVRECETPSKFHFACSYFC